MSLAVLNGPVIEAGESLSAGIDCTGGNIVRLTMPANWTGANITFAISSDGNGYNDLVNTDGEEVTLVVVPGSAVVLGQFGDYLKAIAFLKIRSGTRSHPVEQEDRREFAIAIETAAPAALAAGRAGPGGAQR
jgi:hypothetical protein